VLPSAFRPPWTATASLGRVLDICSRCADDIIGDWQTPLDLAREVVEIVRHNTPNLASVLEPTCGQGAFLDAAASVFPLATLAGFDVSESYVQAARERIPNDRATVEGADFFKVRWERVIERLREPS